jgi:hypothetical protein
VGEMADILDRSRGKASTMALVLPLTNSPGGPRYNGIRARFQDSIPTFGQTS